MTLNQMVYFRQLAHTRHYGYAAEQLFVSQPSISRAIVPPTRTPCCWSGRIIARCTRRTPS